MTHYISYEDLLNFLQLLMIFGTGYICGWLLTKNHYEMKKFDEWFDRTRRGK